MVSLDVDIDPTGAVRGAARANRAMKSIGDTAKRSVTKAGRSVKSLSAQFGGLRSAVSVAAIGVGFKKVVQDAIDYETAFVGVRKTSDLSEAGFKKLSQRFTDLSERIPVSRVELAKIGELAGQLGVSGVDDLAKFSETIAKIAVTTNLTQEDAATGFARFSKIMGEPIENVEKLGDVIVALGNNTETTEREILEMGLRLSGAGKSIGLTSQEVLGIAAALSSVGVQAEAGGTAFSKLFTKLAKDAAFEGGKFNQVIGLTTQELKQLFNTNPAEVMNRFTDSLSKLTKTDLLVFLDRAGIKEERLRSSVLRLVGATGTLRKTTNLANKAAREGGALNEEAAKFFATTENKIKTLSNTFTNLSAAIGKVLLPSLIEMTDMIAPFIVQIRDFAKANPLLTKTLVSMASVVAVGGVLALGLAGLSLLLAPLAGTAGVVVAAFVGAGGLLGALFALRNDLPQAKKAIQDFADNALASLEEFAPKAIAFVKVSVEGVLRSLRILARPAVAIVGQFVSDMLDHLKTLPDRVVRIISDLSGPVTQSLRTFTQSAVDMIFAFAERSLKALRTFTNPAVLAVREFVSRTLETIQGLPQRALALIRTLVNDIVRHLVVFVRPAVEAVQRFVSSTLATLFGLPSAALNLVAGFIDGTLLLLKNMANAAKPHVAAFVDTVVDFVEVLPGQALGVVGGFVAQTGHTLQELATEAKGPVASFIKSVIDTVAPLPERALPHVQSFLHSAVDTLSDLGSQGAAKVSSFVEHVASAARPLIDDATPVITEFVDSAVDRLQSLPAKAKPHVDAFTDGTIDTMTAMANLARPHVQEFVRQVTVELKALAEKAKPKLQAYADHAVDILKALPGLAAPYAIAFVVAVTKELKNLVVLALPYVLSFGAGVLKEMAALPDLVRPYALAFVRAVIETFSDLSTQALPHLRAIGVRAVEVIQELPGKVLGPLQVFAEFVVRKLEEMIAPAVAAMRTFVDRTVETLRALPEKAGKALTDVIIEVGDTLTALPEQGLKAGRGLISAFTQGVKETAFEGLKSITENFIAPIAKLLPGSDAEEGPLSTLTDSGRALPETFAKGIAETQDTAINQVKDMVTQIKAELDLSGGGGVASDDVLSSQNFVRPGHSLTPDTESTTGGIQDLLKGLDAGLNEFKVAAKDTFSQGRLLARSAAQEMGTSFSTFFFDVMDNKFTSLKDAAKGFLNSFLDIAKKIIAKLLTIIIFQKIAGLFAAGAGAAGGAAGGLEGGAVGAGGAESFSGSSGAFTSSGGGAAITGFASGGTLDADGTRGALTSRPSMFRTSELGGAEAFIPLTNGALPVNISGLSGGSGPMKVIINNAPSKANVERSQGRDGEELIITFLNAAADDVKQNGRLGQAIQDVSNFNRVPTQRA